MLIDSNSSIKPDSTTLRDLSNPISTGGEGVIFEHKVQTAFVLIMLVNGNIPCLPGKRIEKIKLQVKYLGYNVDDLLIHCIDPYTNCQHKLLIQIKHSIKITKNDKNFKDVIFDAWNDFNNADLFNQERDAIALVTGPISKLDNDNVRVILEWARDSENAAEFINQKVSLSKFSSKAKRQKFEVLRDILTEANSGTAVSDELLHKFLKRFHLIGYDLDIKAGVIQSLLHTIIAQYPDTDPQKLWARLLQEVSESDKNAGTITRDMLPDDLTIPFQKRESSTIPEQYVSQEVNNKVQDKPTDEIINTVILATILGGWDENKEADQKIIKNLNDEFSVSFDKTIKTCLHTRIIDVSLKNGRWTIKNRENIFLEYSSYIYDQHIDFLNRIALQVLSEKNPMFDLEVEKRIAAGIYGKIPKYSFELKKGISETLAIIGMKYDSFKYCSPTKKQQIPLTIKNLFNDADWILWASLCDVLPILAEAAPQQFLDSVKTSLRKIPSPFKNLYEQEKQLTLGGSNYIYGLYWALETIAWEEEFFAHSILLLSELATLDPGGNCANRPITSIITILLPWFPQTFASQETRVSLIKAIQNKYPEIAWQVLLRLLPNATQTSFGSSKPKFRLNTQEDWKPEIPVKDYYKVIKFISSILLDMAKNNIDHLTNLAESFENLEISVQNSFLEYLSSEEILNMPEENKILIWEKLSSVSLKHRRFPNAKWAMEPSQIDKIDKTILSLKPTNPEEIHKFLFSFDYFQYQLENEDWEAFQSRFTNERKIAIKEIYSTGGISSVLSFAQKVESSEDVGISFSSICTNEILNSLLPEFLDIKAKKTQSFTQGVIKGYFSDHGEKWVDSIALDQWSLQEIAMFLRFLPFEEDTWERVEKFLKQEEWRYWKEIEIHPAASRSDLTYAAEKFLYHNRPGLAIMCILTHLKNAGILLKELAIKALIQNASKPNDTPILSAYQLLELIKLLQVKQDVQMKDIAQIEWIYLQLLTNEDNASPVNLEKLLSSEPEFYLKTIRLVYRSTKTEQIQKSNTKHDEDKNLAENAWKLLYHWKRLPGKQDDDSFSITEFNKWFEFVDRESNNSGHFEVAMLHIGHVLYYSPKDPQGLWIDINIARLLDDDKNEYLRRGFTTEVYNSRGIHNVDTTGTQERDLAEFWKKQADEVEKNGFIEFSSCLKAISKSYLDEAAEMTTYATYYN